MKSLLKVKKTFFSFSFLVCVLLILFACNNASKTNKYLNGDVIVESVSLLQGNEGMLNVVDSVSYVPLFENENFLFSSISKVIIRNDKIYIFDLLGSNSLLCFDLSGTFLFKVGERGSGPNEYSKLWDFDVSGSKIYLYDIAKRQMMLYDLKGKFLKSQKTSFRAEAFKLLDTGEALFSLAKGEPGNELLVKTDSSFVIKKVYLKYSDQDKDDKLTNNIFQETPGTILYNKAVNDTIYSFLRKSGEFEKIYSFDFDNSAVPSDLKGDYSKLSAKRMNEDYMYFFDTPFVVGKTLFGSIFKGKNKATLIYDLKSKKYQIVEWVPNRLNYNDVFLPLFTDGKQVIGWIDLEIYESLRFKPVLSAKAMSHLKEGGRLLTLYKLVR